MASYLSYFTSNNSAVPTQQQQQQQHSQAQPGTSTWTSSFSSRIATLRKALTKDSEEDDPENEDCSHVSNVLRAYYTQKGLPFPDWLPSDPKKPQPVPQMPQQYGQYGSGYGNPYGISSHSRGPSGSGAAGGLSDLWDATPVQRPAPQSLRAPRPTPQSMRSHDSGGRYGPNDAYSAQNSQQMSGPRLLPSQRAGSYQNTAAAGPPTNPKTERLKSRLGGAAGSGRNSPAGNQPNQNPYGDPEYFGGYAGGGGGGAPQTSASQQWSNTGGYDSYAAGGNYGSHGSPGYRQRPSGAR